MLEQGESEKDDCVAFLRSLNNANLGHHTLAVPKG